MRGWGYVFTHHTHSLTVLTGFDGSALPKEEKTRRELLPMSNVCRKPRFGCGEWNVLCSPPRTKTAGKQATETASHFEKINKRHAASAVFL